MQKDTIRVLFFACDNVNLWKLSKQILVLKLLYVSEYLHIQRQGRQCV